VNLALSVGYSRGFLICRLMPAAWVWWLRLGEDVLPGQACLQKIDPGQLS